VGLFSVRTFFFFLAHGDAPESNGELAGGHHHDREGKKKVLTENNTTQSRLKQQIARQKPKTRGN
jgi:hypothetical protein